MTTAFLIDEAVELLKLGAADYIPKPISPEVLNHRLDTTFTENLTLTAELADFKLKDIKTATLESLIRSAPVFSALLERLPSLHKQMQPSLSRANLERVRSCCPRNTPSFQTKNKRFCHR